MIDLLKTPKTYLWNLLITGIGNVIIRSKMTNERWHLIEPLQYEKQAIVEKIAINTR